MYTQKTYAPKASEIEKKWIHIDATDVVVGRLASEVAKILKGKNKPTYAPNIDVGDFVVITNCDKVAFTGTKWDDKKYYWHSNHVGGLKQRTATEQKNRHPELIVMNAVKGMLSKNSIGRKQLTKLKVFTGNKHNHDAQSPQTIELPKREK